MVRPAASWFAIVLLSSSALPAGQQATPPAQRLITENLEFRTAFLPCHAPDIAMRLAKLTGVPAGAETLPGPCGYEKGRGPALESPVNLLGMTMAEAMDTLVALDPRYLWLETGGVIVIRPIDAWNNKQHFLHRALPAFTLDDQNLGGTINQISAARDGDVRHPPYAEIPMRTDQALKKVSVALGTTTLFEAMNAVVREHGAMWWQVNYCQPQALAAFSRVFLYTFDGAGLGTSGFLQRPDGTRQQGCGPSRF
jgi:hypothetical protein